MNARKQSFAVLFAAGALFVTTAGAAEAAAGWRLEPVPVASGNVLSLVSLTPHVTWAAGFQLSRTGTGLHFNTLVMARDDRRGDGWQRVATPGDTVEGRADAMGAHGPGDVWVVGDSAPAPEYGAPAAAYHWDGRRWQSFPAPVRSNAIAAALRGVSVLNAHDAWAVGYDEYQATPDDPENVGFEALMEHWDGTAWRQVRLPVDPATIALESVTATGPGDVWVVGSQLGEPLVLHFDGRSWSTVADLPRLGDYGQFHTVVATGPHDVWAAGDTGRTAAALVEHFDGRRWTRVAAPGDGAVFAAAATPAGIAFVGYDRVTGAPYGQLYDRHGWTDLALPAQGAFESPYSVAVSGKDKELTVGGAYSDADGSFHTLMTSSALPRG